jgi:UDP-N-acetylmuramate--alanine ligase
MPLLPQAGRIHLVGIGGYGLSAIAQVLLEKGYPVSGSDRWPNERTARLAARGAQVWSGHAAEYVAGAALVIVSSAVPADHVEVVAAHAAGIPVTERQAVIGEIIGTQACIAVAGTHGKTTTTAMITYIFLEAGRDPSAIVGGVMANTGDNARYGRGDVFVIEADEYGNMFHGLAPQTAVITSQEWDHPDFFPSPGDMRASFRGFVQRIRPDGLLIACRDDEGAYGLAGQARSEGRHVRTYGLTPGADWQARDVVDDGRHQGYSAWRDGQPLGQVMLGPPGLHNIRNSLAALAVADAHAIPFAEAAQALASFQGSGRRFEIRGQVDGVVVIDDYAHHPTAIRTTLAAARERYPGHTIWAVWQPHMYSRTRDLLGDLLTAFDAADQVLITPIYAAREAPIPGVTAEMVATRMAHPHVVTVPSLDAGLHLLLARVNGPAVIVIMSAGDATRIAGEYLARKGTARD